MLVAGESLMLSTDPTTVLWTLHKGHSTLTCRVELLARGVPSAHGHRHPGAALQPLLVLLLRDQMFDGLL